MTERITQGIRFDTGIGSTDYSDVMVGQTAGQKSTELMPSGTTVTEAIKDVFQLTPTVTGEIMASLIERYASTELRTASGFRQAMRAAVGRLKKKDTAAAREAVAVLEELEADTELLDAYRASLVES